MLIKNSTVRRFFSSIIFLLESVNQVITKIEGPRIIKNGNTYLTINLHRDAKMATTKKLVTQNHLKV